MKKLFFFIAFLLVTANSFSQVYVPGYIRSNGTYVPGHYRTAPNSTRNDNYSTVGNVNPYTGSYGTKPRDSYYTAPTPTYSAPVRTYVAPTYTPTYTNTNYVAPTSYSVPIYSSTRTIYTGPRGGQYYINSNGNKTYVSRN